MIIIERAFFLVLVLGILIFVHELGHFLAAKWFGVRVEVFSLGFGRRLFGFRKGDTDYRVSLIPLGGYVKMAGEMFAGESEPQADHFTGRPRWQRLIVMVAGPAMNIALAIGLYWALFWGGMPLQVEPDGPPVIEQVAEASPAAQAGLQAGDRILTIGGEEIDAPQDYVNAVVLRPGRTLTYEIERDGEELTRNVEVGTLSPYGIGFDGVVIRAPIVVSGVVEESPAERAGLEPGDRLLRIDGRQATGLQAFVERIKASPGEPVQLEVLRDDRPVQLAVVPEETDGAGRIGVSLSSMRMVEGPGEAFSAAVQRAWRETGMVFEVLAGLVQRVLSPMVLSGPLEIARISQEVAAQGFLSFVALLAFISLQLGVFNLLPIPVLDGGQITILLAESAARRDLPMRVKERVLQLGFLFIIVFAVSVLALDFYKQVVISGEGPGEPQVTEPETQPKPGAAAP
jgi:regulator of sigma E protease